VNDYVLGYEVHTGDKFGGVIRGNLSFTKSEEPLHSSDMDSIREYIRGLSEVPADALVIILFIWKFEE
jgi:hypothetical protein